MRYFNFNWEEGTRMKNGFNFDRGSKRGTLTIFRSAFLLPIKKEKDEVYVDPLTKNLCWGQPVKYFSLYFRLRKVLSSPFDFVLSFFVNHKELRILETWEQRADIYPAGTRFSRLVKTVEDWYKPLTKEC